MPPSLRDWLPEGHLVWFVLDAVEEMDLGAFYADYRDDGHGRPAHDPALMVALVLYAYAVGERSSRRIECCCVESVAFRVIAGNRAPDHSTIARFVGRHQERMEALFAQVLGLCARAGLAHAGTIALDSTKIQANASGLANRTYEQIAREIFEEAKAIDAAEDERYGEARGDELPPELADPKTRRARLREAKRQLEAEWQAERDARQAMLDRRARHEAETGRRPTGRPPVDRELPDAPRGRRNVTDPESRPVKTPRGFIQGYNAQAAATADQIIVCADVVIGSPDQGLLEPMTAQATSALEAVGAGRPEVLLADAGYWNTEQISALHARGIDVVVKPDGEAGRRRPQKQNALAAELRKRLQTADGKALYSQRRQIIEPIFGQTKANRRIDRFLRRGLAACRSEWRLITATHNLTKLWRHSLATAAN